MNRPFLVQVMYKKLLSMSAIAATLYMSAALPVYANAVPDFGTCVNPQWSQTQVNTGSNHGVINVGSFAGTDTIYQSNGNVLQCLCTDSGEGYQTNWLKVSDYSNAQIDELKAQGWMYVPYGKDWGLDNAPYLAKNETYTCTSCTPTPTTVTPTETPAPGPTSTPGPTTTPTPETKVEAAAASNLASTGTKVVILVSLLAGVASLIAGMVIRKKTK